ncbi:LptF/LptG family permease [Flavobacterium rhizosphaerae]|uniref:LptF/LptG family permease n=1 Tax=Flavobacterium rhizosphaerae TaxID=3163298 RepID=A0ABW8YY36_9FLAO
MKILDRYILVSFVKTFSSVFIILFFIFILQGIWLFISELAGKDLDFWIVIKFLFFYSPKVVPLVLPLSVLLASIMTFGSFAENYEFAAMKSSGISLKRAMRGLTIFILILSAVSFVFANNVIPQAEYKFTNMRRNIMQRKPAMAIAAGQFTSIGENFNIKVDKKDGENGEKLTGVTIHKRKTGASNATIIKSKRGLLIGSEKSNLLQLELYDGYYYEDIFSKKPAERLRQPFAKSSFSKHVMNIDLSQFNSEDMESEDVGHTDRMLNVTQLNYTLDSLNKNYSNEKQTIADNVAQRPNAVLKNYSQPKRTARDSVTKPVLDSIPENLTTLVEIYDLSRIYETAYNNVNSNKFLLSNGQRALFEKTKNINSHWLALYEKFVIAFSCILMFFIGAPLGAIIRKGGLGLPIVFAVLIFIIFHFINTFGKKLAQENGIPPFLGSWMSSFVLGPLAILLTYRATNDIGLINFDNIFLPVQKAISNIFKNKKTEE